MVEVTARTGKNEGAFADGFDATIGALDPDPERDARSRLQMAEGQRSLETVGRRHPPLCITTERSVIPYALYGTSSIGLSDFSERIRRSRLGMGSMIVSVLTQRRSDEHGKGHMRLLVDAFECFASGTPFPAFQFRIVGLGNSEAFRRLFLVYLGRFAPFEQRPRRLLRNAFRIHVRSVITQTYRAVKSRPAYASPCLRSNRHGLRKRLLFGDDQGAL